MNTFCNFYKNTYFLFFRFLLKQLCNIIFEEILILCLFTTCVIHKAIKKTMQKTKKISQYFIYIYIWSNHTQSPPQPQGSSHEDGDAHKHIIEWSGLNDMKQVFEFGGFCTHLSMR